MVQTLLEVADIRTVLADSVVHERISFKIERPQVLALIGGSGCGKSVLLKEIIGLLRPTSGNISLLGLNVWQSSQEDLVELRKRFGVLFQNGALFSALSVFDNIATPFREQSHLKQKLLSELVFLRLGLSGLPASAAYKMPSELSGGMRKRAALARALALEPQVLFLDEPTSGLDPVNARAFDKLIRTLCDSLGLTVIIVTHDLDTLWGIVDRAIVLGEGKVLADGTVDAVSKVAHPWISSYFSARVT